MAKLKKRKANPQLHEVDQRYADPKGAVSFHELWSNLQSSAKAKANAIGRANAIGKAKANEKVRTLGEILSSEPRNNGETKKLEEFRVMEREFVSICRKEAGFTTQDDAAIDAAIKVLIQKSNRRRDVRNGQFHCALMTQRKPESIRLLKRIIADVRHQVAVFRERSNTRACGFAKSIGYGGYQSDCCQECGNFLYSVCYSTHRDSGKVPRTNKICKRCFSNLPGEIKRDYAKYEYSSESSPQVWGGMQT